MKEKIVRLEIKHSVGQETWIHTDFCTNKSVYNNYIKSHYLQEYDGITLRFHLFVLYACTSKTAFSFYCCNVSKSGLQKLELGLFKPQVRRPKLKLNTTTDVIQPPAATRLKTYKVWLR